MLLQRLSFSFLLLPVLGLLLILDALWIGGGARSFYETKIGHLLSGHILWIAAFFLYVLYALALISLVIRPALREKSLAYALWAGALFGVVAYGVYDLTTMTGVAGKLLVIGLDMAWGA